MVDLVCGLWRLDGQPVEERELQDMLAALTAASRRTASKMWRDGSIGLARISIGQNFSETEMAANPSGAVCAADVRLYNRDELTGNSTAAAELADKTDEQLVLHAWETHGEDACEHLDGDYAGVVWDPAKRELFCLRDHLGVRPFFYAYVPGKLFAFASLAKGIRAKSVFPAELDTKAVLANFARDMSSRETTYHKGILRLAPGHTMTVRETGLTIRKYWQLEVRNPVPSNASFEEYALQLRKLVTEAVHRRVPASGQLAAHMSGGLDSTSIAILAAEKLQEDGRRLATYSFVSEERPDVVFEDERPYVDLVAQRIGNIDNEKIGPPPLSIELAGDMMDDRPLSLDPRDPENQVAAKAAATGADVVLSGWGGDEIVTFNGRGVLAEHLVRFRWLRLYQEAKALKAERKRTWAQIAQGEIAQYILPEWSRNIVRRLAGRTEPRGADRFTQMFSPSVQAGLTGSKLKMTTSSRANRLILFNNGHIPYRLENWAYQGAEQGIAYAFPLLDVKLLEFAIRMPASFFVRDGFKRALFRQAMDDILPESVRTRHVKLAPFPCVLLRAAEKKQEMKQRLDEIRNDAQLAGLFDFRTLDANVEALPAVDAVKKAFNEEAVGGDRVDLAPVTAQVPVGLANYLRQKLPGKKL